MSAYGPIMKICFFWGELWGYAVCHRSPRKYGGCINLCVSHWI